MILLLVFAFLSGLVTIAAPCIWPLLPIILSSTATGGHRKPLGITLGIAISFGLLTLFLSTFLAIIPLDPNILRYIAVVVLGFFGLMLLVPQFSRVLEGLVSRVSGKFGTTNESTGFSSGFATGLALGVVWTPCAGPIFATIAVLAATQKISFSLILVTFVYVVGISIPLFLFATIGRQLFIKSRFLSHYTGTIQRVFGFVMILTALLIVTNYDTILEARLLDYFPSYTQFINTLEGNPAVKKQLDTIKNQQSNSVPISGNDFFNTTYRAPDFVGISTWLNTDKPIRLADLKGKVVLVDFWTYTCINCIRTLPHITSWYNKYKDQGFVVIGVHTPEFSFEKDTTNVLKAIRQDGITYPVAQDNAYTTWNNFSNQYWPAEYLIDAQGNVRRTHFGEGEYDITEKAIQALLQENGKKVASSLIQMPDQTPTGNISPETYLGSDRMQFYFPDGSLTNGTQTFTLTNNPPVNSFSYGGQWTIEGEDAIAAAHSVLTYHFNASKVFLILRPPTETSIGTVRIFLDGKMLDVSSAGFDVFDSTVTVTTDRLYNLIDLHGKTEDHVLKLEFQTPNVKAYTFTFG